MSGKTRVVCPYCSLGCTMFIHPGAPSSVHGPSCVPTLEFDVEGETNRGSLCPRGNMLLELLGHPDRLTEPLLRENGRVRTAGWADTLDALDHGLSEILRESGPSAIGRPFAYRSPLYAVL